MYNVSNTAKADVTCSFDFQHMKKIVITGIGGYIGSVSASLFLKAGYTVIGIDNFSRGNKGAVAYLEGKYPDTLHFHECDVRETEKLTHILESEHTQSDSSIDAVIHYAALCNVGESEKHPELYFDVNVQGVVSLLEAMRAVDLKKIVFSSTCAIYGEPESDVLSEDHPIHPTSHPYGESKYMAERVIDWYDKVYGFRYIFLRYFNVCGATDDGEIGDSKNPSYHLMQNAVRGSLGIDEFFLNFTPVDTPDGSPIRDYVDVVDLNMAHIKAVEYIQTVDHSDIFNLGTGSGYSVLEIVHKVQEITGKTFDIKETERRKGDVVKAVASNEKITRVLGWKPEHSLEDSVKSLVSWYTQHPHGWDE